MLCFLGIRISNLLIFYFICALEYKKKIKININMNNILKIWSISLDFVGFKSLNSIAVNIVAL